MSKEGFSKKYAKFLIKHAWALTIILLVLAGLSLPRVTHLFKNLSTDTVDLLPADFPSVKALLEIREYVELKRQFAILIESPDPEATKNMLLDLAGKFEKHPQVAKALIKKPGYDFLDKNKFLYADLADLKEMRDRLDRKIQQKKLGGLYINLEDDDKEEDFESLEEKYRERYGETGESPYYVTPNGLIYALYLEGYTPNPNLKQEMEFQDEIKDSLKNFDYKAYHPNMKLSFAGSSRIMEYRALLRDLKVAGAISLVALCLPLLIRFRRPQYVLLIFLPLAVGIPIGLALASFWVPRLNVTTSFLFAILGGLGVETGIHLFSRYYEKRKEGLDLEAAWIDVLHFLFRPALTAVMALAGTFFLMYFTDFRGFSEFGIISFIGLLTVFFVYFSFFPALMSLAERYKFFKIYKIYEEKESLFSLSPGFVKTLLAIFIGFSLFSIYGAYKVRFEYNSKKIRADLPEAKTAKIKQRLTKGGRVNTPAITLIDNQAQAKALEKAIKDRQEKNPSTLIQRTGSLYDLVPPQQEEKLAVLSQTYQLLTQDAMKLINEERLADLEKFKTELKRPEKFDFAQVPEEIKIKFLSKDKTKSIFFIFPQPGIELDDGRNSMGLSAELGLIKTPEGDFYPSSSSIVFGDVLKTLFKDASWILISAILSVFFFVYLDFKNLKRSIVVLASISLGLLWVFGVMYLLRMKLNLYSMSMIPAILGMSVDNSIHLYHRYRELGPGSLARVWSTSGVAALLASVTNAAGFVGLTFSTHGGLRSMGVLALLGLGTCLLTTLVFMPLALQYWEWRKFKIENLQRSNLEIVDC